VAAALFLALTVCASRPAAAGASWRSLARETVTVLFREEDRRAAARVLDVAAPAAVRLWSELEAGTPPPIRLVVASTDEEFDRLGGGVPDWGVGWADASRGLVALRSPRLVEYPLQMEAVVVHEIAHLAVASALAGVDTPRWFEEGAAMGLAGEWDGDGKALGAAAVTGRLLPLSAIERSFPEDRTDAALAYAESFRAVRLLARESGVTGEAGLVRAVASAPDFASAVESLSGVSVSEFDGVLRAHLRRTFGWGSALRGAGALVALGAAVLGVAALRRRRRSRRRLRELEEEESAAGPGPRTRTRTGSSWS
jgi:hypothetical protein